MSNMCSEERETEFCHTRSFRKLLEHEDIQGIEIGLLSIRMPPVPILQVNTVQLTDLFSLLLLFSMLTLSPGNPQRCCQQTRNQGWAHEQQRMDRWSWRLRRTPKRLAYDKGAIALPSNCNQPE